MTAGRNAAAPAQKLKGLEAIAYKRAVEGKMIQADRNFAQAEKRASPTDELLRMLHQQAEPSDTDAAALAKSILTWNEWRAHIRFNHRGEKYDAADPRAAEMVLLERQEKVLRRLRNYVAAGGGCPCCRQQLPAGWPRASIMEMQVLGVVNIWDHRDGWGALGPTRTRPDPVDVFIPPLI